MIVFALCWLLASQQPVRDTFETAGKLVRGDGKSVLVGHAIADPKADIFKILATVVVTDEKKIGPNTIFRSTYYAQYEVAQGGPSEAMIKRRLGTEVKLRLIRTGAGSVLLQGL